MAKKGHFAITQSDFKSYGCPECGGKEVIEQVHQTESPGHRAFLGTCPNQGCRAVFQVTTFSVGSVAPIAMGHFAGEIPTGPYRGKPGVPTMENFAVVAEHPLARR